MTICRPSERGADSTFATGSKVSRTLSSSSMPSSWCAISRPRNRMVVRVDVRPQLDFLDLDHLLLLARFGGLLLCGVFEAAKIEHLGDGRHGVGGDQDEIEAQFLGLCDGVARTDNALVLTFSVDQLDVGAGNILVRKRPLFLGRDGSHGTTNGWRSFGCYQNGGESAKIVSHLQ